MTNDKLYFLNSDKKAFTRYDLGKFLEFSNGGFDPLTSTFLDEIADLKLGGYYTVKGEDKKPDLLAYNIFGDIQYWWVLMAYNGFNSVNDIKNGEQVKFPSVSALEDFYFSLKTRERISS